MTDKQSKAIKAYSAWKVEQYRLHPPSEYKPLQPSDLSGPGPAGQPISEAYLLENGDQIFTLTWDSASRVGGGVLSIVSMDAAYFYIAEEGLFGPFESLLDAIKSGDLNAVSLATVSIRCSEIEANKLANLLEPADGVEPGFKIQLNGESWEFDEKLRLTRSS